MKGTDTPPRVCAWCLSPFRNGRRKKGRVTALIIIAGLLTLVLNTWAQEDDLTTLSAVLAPRAEGLIAARCSVCHSPDLITQQRLPRDRWMATVDKMVQWGAQVSPEEAALLVRYLSARYHPGAPEQLAPLQSAHEKAEPSAPGEIAEGPVAGVADRGAALFAHNCQACHGSGAMGGMGPKLAKSPILKHEDLFWETVLHGRGPMPAWGSALSHQDIADIHAWLAEQ